MPNARRRRSGAHARPSPWMASGRLRPAVGRGFHPAEDAGPPCRPAGNRPTLRAKSPTGREPKGHDRAREPGSRAGVAGECDPPAASRWARPGPAADPLASVQRTVAPTDAQLALDVCRSRRPSRRSRRPSTVAARLGCPWSQARQEASLRRRRPWWVHASKGRPEWCVVARPHPSTSCCAARVRRLAAPAGLAAPAVGSPSAPPTRIREEGHPEANSPQEPIPAGGEIAWIWESERVPAL